VFEGDVDTGFGRETSGKETTWKI